MAQDWDSSHPSGGEGRPWRRLSSAVVHRNRWFEVRRDSVVRPDGYSDIYSHVITSGSVTVIAVDEWDRMMVTRQWIYTHGGVQWRLPGGGIESFDIDPLRAAHRELVEETGLRAARWERLGRVHGADSFTNHVDHAFLATELSQHERHLEPSEADLTLYWVPFDKALEMVASGELVHAGSVYAVLSMAVRRTS